MKSLFLPAILAAALAPAHAQTAAQTPENAQKFIGIVASQGATRLTMTIATRRVQDPGYTCGGGDTVCYRDLSRTGSVNAAQASGNCSTSFGVYFVSFRDGRATVYPENPSQTAVLNWSRVAGVNVSGSYIGLSGAAPIEGLYLPTSELATRVGAAFEVLRKACDPTGDTGF